MKMGTEVYEDYVAQPPVRSLTFWLLTLLVLSAIAFGMKIGLSHWEGFPAGRWSFVIAMAVVPLPWIHAWQQRRQLRRFVLSCSAQQRDLTSDEKKILGESAAATFNSLVAAYIAISALLSAVRHILAAG